MKIYLTEIGTILESEGRYIHLEAHEWDTLFQTQNVNLNSLMKAGQPITATTFQKTKLLKPLVSQEVWAAGVTYYRSRTARMEESRDGGSVYDRVYAAERPEIFFKATPSRAVGPGEEVYIRHDSTWDVPEPELTLAINRHGNIIGYTIGNDMSSRSIEGENPLYLPQAKTYERCAAIGPCIYITDQPLSKETRIRLEIRREQQLVFSDEIELSQMKRTPDELVSYLFRECIFPNGCLLMTGTGIVPPHDFTLVEGDAVEITIDGIGTLKNKVARQNKMK
ncbi:MAG: fumarylacetoacetate hydrolase family protein [Saprospiraceae bacterium]|nr:fumarylacetoacetate hydrolase family protein [Saprospiraceae bacterium]